MRAIYRGYWSGGKRAGQVRRLHVIREHGPKGRVARETLCGQHAWNCQNSEAVVIDPLPAKPPEGLSWCAACVGKASELAGLLDEIAAMVAARDLVPA